MDRSAKHVVRSYVDQRSGTVGPSTPGIVCPKCGAPTMVTNTRRFLGIVRRYRQCVRPMCRFRLIPTEEKTRNPASGQNPT